MQQTQYLLLRALSRFATRAVSLRPPVLSPGSAAVLAPPGPVMAQRCTATRAKAPDRLGLEIEQVTAERNGSCHPFLLCLVKVTSYPGSGAVPARQGAIEGRFD